MILLVPVEEFCRIGCLNLDTTDTLDWVVIHHGSELLYTMGVYSNSPVHPRMISSIPGLYP